MGHVQAITTTTVGAVALWLLAAWAIRSGDPARRPWTSLRRQSNSQRWPDFPRKVFFACTFIKIHRTLRTSPAMAAGVTDRLWSVEDLVALWEAYEQRRAERAA